MSRRRSPAGPIVVLILMFAGSSFVGLAPRGAQQPGAGPVIPTASVHPSKAGADTPVFGVSGNAVADLRGASDSKTSERPRVSAATTSPGPRPTAGVSSSKASPSPHIQAVGKLPHPSVRGLAVPASRTPRVAATQYAIHSTWYCGNGSRCTSGYPSDGLYAAISPDLRTWTGRLVRVRYGASSVVVRIADCDCQAEHSIDLYSSAFRRLAPLAVGELTVTLELLEE